MINEYDPDRPEELSSWLGTHVNDHWNNYLDYWELQNVPDEPAFTEEQRDLHRRLDRVGGEVRRLIHTLAPDEKTLEAFQEIFPDADPDRVDEETAALISRRLHESPLVRDSVRIRLAFELTDSLLPSAEERLPNLIALIGSRITSPTASSYLARATRLYLFGFDEEAVVMCRSTLEAALHSLLYPDLAPDEPSPRLEQLLRKSGEQGLLPGLIPISRRKWTAENGTLLWKANRIRITANRLVHEWAVLGSDEKDELADAVTALRDLAEILGELSPS